jgi:hypothetical protein
MNDDVSAIALLGAPAAPGLLDDFLTEDELAAELNRTTRTLRIWQRQKIGPAATYVGRSPLYRKETVRKWILDNEGRGRQTRPPGRPPGRPRNIAG